MRIQVNPQTIEKLFLFLELCDVVLATHQQRVVLLKGPQIGQVIKANEDGLQVLVAQPVDLLNADLPHNSFDFGLNFHLVNIQ